MNSAKSYWLRLWQNANVKGATYVKEVGITTSTRTIFSENAPYNSKRQLLSIVSDRSEANLIDKDYACGD